MNNLIVTKYMMSCLGLEKQKKPFCIWLRLKMFSILIPTYNNKDYLEFCINSIKKLMI